MMQSIIKQSRIVVLPLLLLSCSSSNNEVEQLTHPIRLGTFTYSYTVASNSETVALSGDPTGQTGFAYTQFSESALNDNGQLAFFANSISSDITTEADGIWIRDNQAAISPVANRGGNVSYTSDLQYDLVSPHFLLNQLGQVLFTSTLAGLGVNGTNNLALLISDSSGSVLPLARSGDIAPGWLAPFESTFTEYDLNDFGEAVFIGEVNLGPDSSVDGDLILPGIWKRNGDGSVVSFLSYGDDAPETGSTFSTFGKVNINNHSQLLVEARAGFYWKHGVWIADANNTLAKIAFEGDQAPGLSGVTLGKSSSQATPLMSATINDNNEIVLFSALEGPTVDNSNDHALWFRDTLGKFHLISREGDVAPQSNADIFVSALMGSVGDDTAERPRLNKRGQVLFSTQIVGSSVDNTNDKALWLWDLSGVHKVIQSGESIVGLAPGEIIASFSLAGTSMQLNDNGEVLVQVQLSGPGVDTTNDLALVYYNITSGANIFIRKGENIQVKTGDFRSVSDYLMEGQPGINNSSQVLFAAGFTNSAGLFLISPQAVPLPPRPSDTGGNPNSGCNKTDDGDDDEKEFEHDDNGLEIESSATHADEQEECEIEEDDTHKDDKDSGGHDGGMCPIDEGPRQYL